MIELDAITCYLLAGGRSSRFGRDKRLLVWKGETLIGRAERLLLDLSKREPYIVGDNLDDLDLAHSCIIGDALPGRGPLGGLVAALEHCPTAWALVLAVDLPLIDRPHLETLIATAGPSMEIWTLSADGRPEPLAALYSRTTGPFWRTRLKAGQNSVSKGIRRCRWKPVFLEKQDQALLNINDKTDLDRLAEDLFP